MSNAKQQAYSNRILIVDDETDMEDLVRMILQELNVDIHWVATYAMAEKALQEESYDLVICDYILADKPGGVALWDFVRTNFPQVGFLLVSGAPEVAVDDLKAEGKPVPQFLSKPFAIDEYRERVAQFLYSAARNAEPIKN